MTFFINGELHLSPLTLDPDDLGYSLLRTIQQTMMIFFNSLSPISIFYLYTNIGNWSCSGRKYVTIFSLIKRILSLNIWSDLSLIYTVFEHEKGERYSWKWKDAGTFIEKCFPVEVEEYSDPFIFRCLNRCIIFLLRSFNCLDHVRNWLLLLHIERTFE